MMKVKLAKQGNSVGLLIPSAIVREQGLEVGQEFELAVNSRGNLELEQTTGMIWKPDLTIDELLAGLPCNPLTYEDIPEYVPMGRELDW